MWYEYITLTVMYNFHTNAQSKLKTVYQIRILTKNGVDNDIPLLEVYNKAAWKQQVFVSSVSSIDICMPNPASGLMFGNDSKSVDRTKKFP